MDFKNARRVADPAFRGRRGASGARLRERRRGLLHFARRPRPDQRIPARGGEVDRRALDRSAVPLPQPEPARDHHTGSKAAFAAPAASPCDYDADLAERYGWINRALPRTELPDFVRSLAHRIEGFRPRAARRGE